MANMFSGKSNKQVPKDLKECLRSDSTVTNLHNWAERLENWGQILFVIIVIVGVITTIISTVEMADVNEDLMFTTFLSSAITWALYAFIEYCAYHVLALLISALATITQNVIISANVALFESGQTHGIPEEEPSAANPNVFKKVIGEDQKECYACGHVQSATHRCCENCGEFMG